MISKSQVTGSATTTDSPPADSSPEGRYGRVAPWAAIDYLIAAAVALCTLGLLMWLLREPMFSDDLTYFEYAEQVGRGNLPRPQIANVYRLGFIYSIIAVQSVLGYSITAYYAIAIGYGIAMVIAFYVLNRLFFGRIVAVAASTLLITNPIFLSETTVLNIDIPALFWFTIALVLLWGGVTTTSDGRRPLSQHRQAILYFVLAGMALFFAYWIKEGIVILFPALPLTVFFLGSRAHRLRTMLKALVASGGTFAALLGLELLLYHHVYGDAFIRLSMIVGGHIGGSRQAWIERGLVADDLLWSDLLLRYPENLVSSTYGVILLILAVAAILFSGVVRDRRLLALSSLSVVGWLILTLAVTSIEPLVPLIRVKERYLSAPLFPLFGVVAGSAVVASAVVIRRYSRMRRWVGLLSKMAFVGVIAGVAIVGVSEVQGRSYFTKNGAAAMSATKEIVAEVRGSEKGITRVFSDVRTLRGVRMYVPRRDWSALKPLDSLWQDASFDIRSRDEFLPGDLVILNRNRLYFNEDAYYEQPLPDWVLGPPAHWMEAVRTEHPNVSVYYVAPVTDVASKEALLQLLHAYHHGPMDQQGEIVERLDSNIYEIGIDGADDIRIVTGRGPYHLSPGDPQYPLTIDGFETLFITVVVEVADDAQVRAVTAWTLGDDVDPVSVKFERRVLDDESHEYVGTVRTDPTDGYDYLRIMIQVSGSGDVGVTDLKVERLKNSDDLPVAIFPSEPGPVTGGP